MGGVPGVRPAKVVVLGGGVVGTHAARMAAGLGADVSIIDRSLPRLRQLDELFEGRVRTLASTMESVETEVLAADVVVGAVLVAGASAPKLVTRDMLPRMKRGAVLVDVSIDQGGCFETSRPTTHDEPTFEVDGIIHYCVANMPGAVPVTSAQALNNATLPFVIKLAAQGVAAFDDDKHLAAGLNVRDGRIMHAAVASSLGFDRRDRKGAPRRLGDCIFPAGASPHRVRKPVPSSLERTGFFFVVCAHRPKRCAIGHGNKPIGGSEA